MSKKPGLPPTESPASLRVSERTSDGHYSVQREAEFAFEMHAVTSFDLHSIDSFLEDPRLPGDIRAALIEERQEAFHTYANGSFEVAKTQFIALHRACLFHGTAIAVRPAVQEQKRTREARKKGGAAAAAVRAKLPVREDLMAEIEALKSKRQLSEADAKSAIRQKYGASSSGLSQKLKPPKKK